MSHHPETRALSPEEGAKVLQAVGGEHHIMNTVFGHLAHREQQPCSALLCEKHEGGDWTCKLGPGNKEILYAEAAARPCSQANVDSMTVLGFLKALCKPVLQGDLRRRGFKAIHLYGGEQVPRGQTQVHSVHQ